MNYQEPCDILNALFTKDELQYTIDNLKNNKATDFVGITNEMIKNSPENVLNIILNFTNLCLQKALIPDSFCNDIINPNSDPNNYRVQQIVDAKNLISRNQIGFKKGSRTGNHLKAIVKKYVTLGKEKLYVCLVDFKKTLQLSMTQGYLGSFVNLVYMGTCYI